MEIEWLTETCKTNTPIMLRASANQDLRSSILLRKSEVVSLRIVTIPSLRRTSIWQMWVLPGKSEDVLQANTTKQWLPGMDTSKHLGFTRDSGRRMSRMHDNPMDLVHVPKLDTHFIRVSANKQLKMIILSGVWKRNYMFKHYRICS